MPAPFPVENASCVPDPRDRSSVSYSPAVSCGFFLCQPLRKAPAWAGMAHDDVHAGEHGAEWSHHSFRGKSKRPHANSNGCRKRGSLVLASKLISIRTLRSSFGLSSMSSAMPMSSSAASAKATGLAARLGTSVISSGFQRLSPGMSGSMSSQSESVMPPNFGYPFYQPPSLLSSSWSFMGMSSM